MYDKSLVMDIINQVLPAIARIERRASGITNPHDFVASDQGLDMLDAITMMLIAIGESCKNLDKITAGTLLANYPEVDWKGVKGMRDVISHHYFSISAEIVLSVCRRHIPVIKAAFQKMLLDLSDPNEGESRNPA